MKKDDIVKIKPGRLSSNGLVFSTNFKAKVLEDTTVGYRVNVFKDVTTLIILEGWAKRDASKSLSISNFIGVEMDWDYRVRSKDSKIIVFDDVLELVRDESSININNPFTSQNVGINLTTQQTQKDVLLCLLT